MIASAISARRYWCVRYCYPRPRRRYQLATAVTIRVCRADEAETNGDFRRAEGCSLREWWDAGPDVPAAGYANSDPEALRAAG